jgi:hypothetical protein
MNEKEKKLVQERARGETGEVMPEPKTKKIFKRGNGSQRPFNKNNKTQGERTQRDNLREQGGMRPKGSRQPGSKERWSKQEGRDR